MRVALVTQSCDSETGIGRIVRSLGREFAKRDHYVNVIAQKITAPEEGWHGLLVPSVPGSGSLNRLSLRYSVPNVLQQLNCDIVNSFLLGRGSTVVTAQSCHLAGMEILRRHKRNYVWNSGFGLFDRVAVSDERRLFHSPATKRIIAVSKLVKNQIVDYYEVDPSRIAVVPNGIDLWKFDELRSRGNRSTLRSAYGIVESDFLLLFVGNEFDRKGLQPLMNSLAFLKRKELRLLVVGSDNERVYGELARRLGISSQIIFAGKIANPEEFFLAADLFVFPTLYEPFGLVILESMAAGLPAVTSRAAGAVEGLVHRKHGWYLDDPTSIDELADAIRQMMDDPELRRDTANGSLQVAQRFSWSRIADETLKVYEAARGEL